MSTVLPWLGAAVLVTPAAAEPLPSPEPPPAACRIEWQNGSLRIEADRPVAVRTASLPEPERRIIDLLGADLADPLAPTRLEAGQAGVRQVRIARHPETKSLRIVLDLEGAATLRAEIRDDGRTLVARLEGDWLPAAAMPLGPPVPPGLFEVGPAAPLTRLAFIGPPAPEQNWERRPPPAPKRPTDSPATLLGPDELASEPPATRSVPWPSVQQVVTRMRIRREGGVTTLEIRARARLMAWVQQELAPARLTVRFPRSRVAADVPRPRGVVERVALRREEEAWALALDLERDVMHLFDSEPTTDGHGLLVRIRRAPPLDARKAVVVVDPGHGGYDPGALGAGGTTESQVNLEVARILARTLAEAGLQPVLTRTMDAELRLEDRLALVERLDPALVVSLHCNSSEAQDAAGIETYYRHDSGQRLARTIHERLLTATGRPDRGVRTAQLFILRPEQIPASLVELGFLSSRGEETLLADPSYQRTLAGSIAAGVKSYLESRSAAAAGVPASGN